MPAPQSGLTLRAAPILHLSLVGSSLAVLGVFWFLRGGVPIALLPASRGTIGYVAYALAAGLLAAGIAIRARISEPERGGDRALWWQENRPKVLALWILGDFGCIAGAVLWFLTDSQVVLLALGGVGLFLLAAHPPSRLFAQR